ncbi:hypothetical protein C9413_03315 [Rhizobium sp. SEMIA 4085]|nr:hypothetical protein [Rhizobium sp. SEMIA 4085]
MPTKAARALAIAAEEKVGTAKAVEIAERVGMGEGLAAQLLSYQANKPILDRLMKEAGFDGDNAVSSLLDNLGETWRTERDSRRRLDNYRIQPVASAAAQSGRPFAFASLDIDM